MAALPRRSFVSVEAYFELDDASSDERYEYIDGTVRMMTGGTVQHSIIATNVTGLLYNLLRGGPCRAFNSDVRVRLSETRYVYPDASASCDEQDLRRRDSIHNPCLIVEVLSPSTIGSDRVLKFAYYRACPSVKEYLLIYTELVQVELFRRERGDLWTYHAFDAEDEVPLTSLNSKVLVKDIYEQVDMQAQHEE